MNTTAFDEFFQVTSKYEAVIHVRLFRMIEAYITNHTDELGRVSFPSDPWSRVPYNFTMTSSPDMRWLKTNLPTGTSPLRAAGGTSLCWMIGGPLSWFGSLKRLKQLLLGGK